MASILDPAREHVNPIFKECPPLAAQHRLANCRRRLQTLGQLGEMSGPMRRDQPLRQVTSLFSQVGGWRRQPSRREAARVGLLGDPLSNHPLAGGSGPSAGAKAARGSLPGAGGCKPARRGISADQPVAPSVMPAAAAPDRRRRVAPLRWSAGEQWARVRAIRRLLGLVAGTARTGRRRRDD